MTNNTYKYSRVEYKTNGPFRELYSVHSSVSLDFEKLSAKILIGHESIEYKIVASIQLGEQLYKLNLKTLQGEENHSITVNPKECSINGNKVYTVLT